MNSLKFSTSWSLEITLNEEQACTDSEDYAIDTVEELSCGPDCASVTKLQLIEAKRSCWSSGNLFSLIFGCVNGRVINETLGWWLLLIIHGLGFPAQVRFGHKQTRE